MALSHESLLNVSQQTEASNTRPTQQTEVKWLILQDTAFTRIALRASEARASSWLCSVWAWEAEERDQLR